MKKILTLVAAFFLFFPSVKAAQFFSDSTNKFGKENIENWASLTVQADKDQEIKAEYGINLVLDEEVWVLWQEGSLELSGSAVTKGRVSPQAAVTFSSDYKTLHIPVKSNFVSGETLEIQGLQVRTYNQTASERYLGLDLNGDLMPDVLDDLPFSIEDAGGNDAIAPYPVSGISYTLKNGAVELKWVSSPDYDLEAVRIDKTYFKDGVSKEVDKVYSNVGSSFMDLNSEKADKITYRFTAIDAYGNESETKEITVDLTGQMPGEDMQGGGQTSPVSEDAEIKNLKELMPYYWLRYQINCLTPVTAPEENYNCYWPTIDLLYAQEKTGIIQVANLTLSDRMIELMQLRRKWPERYYADFCMSEPKADYCDGLQIALARLHYFLD